MFRYSWEKYLLSLSECEEDRRLHFPACTASIRGCEQQQVSSFLNIRLLLALSLVAGTNEILVLKALESHRTFSKINNSHFQ